MRSVPISTATNALTTNCCENRFAYSTTWRFHRFTFAARFKTKRTSRTLENNEEKRDEFVSNYNRSEVLDAIAEQKAALDEVANEENALLLGQSKWAEAIRLLRKGQYETLEATERVFK